NEGNMRFTDVTDAAGVTGVGYAMGAAAADYDNDGHVDLFVAGVRRNQLLHNRGDGRFYDVTTRAGIGSGEWAVAAGWLDFDRDGRVDVFVTNDTVPNYLFHNNGDGTFSDIALGAGVSVPDTGRPVSAMGADVQDYDNDGWDDILIAALTGETLPLFRNDRRGAFVEATQASGVARLTVKASGWCAIAADLNNDGWPDIFSANSDVNDRI